jgi:hypothetical protein
MDAKTRIILPTLMSAMMVLMVTFVVTLLNLGLRADFLAQWGKAYMIAWPIAAATGYLILPLARRATARIVAYIEESA